jgi:hypothetical protein
MQRDFMFLKGLIADFFKKTSLQQGLQIAHEQNITGWEVWLQIEFACFLAHHESEVEWWRETILAYDGRKEAGKIFLKPDFLLRKKGWRKDSYAALEMKQHPDASSCINNMLKDIVKISKIRKSELDLRTYWALGVFLRDSKSELKQKLLEKAQIAKIDLDASMIDIKYIKNTNYAYMIF